MKKYFLFMATAALLIVACTKDPPAVVHATGVTLNPSDAFLLVGCTLTLEVTVKPDNVANKTVKWSSDDNHVATVNSAGEVTALAPGTAKITVTTDDGGFKAVCNVTVEEEPDEPPIPATGVITMSTLASEMKLVFTIETDIITIDWGDGEISNINDGIYHYSTRPFPHVAFSHTYSHTSAHNITITGNNIVNGLFSNLQLTNLDISRNTALTYLDCSGNQLASLDVSRITALTYLYCPKNQITSLDVSCNTALTFLSCNNNQITSLDVSRNTALTDLFCSNNQLTNLDVSRNTALTFLGCTENQLANLDVSRNTALFHLECGNNQLTSLDVSRNTALFGLMCFNNRLSSLDLSRNTNVFYFYCFGNLLTTLNVSSFTNLNSLDCSDNQLTSSALNDLFGTLHINPGPFERYVYIADNPGTSDCNVSIAEEKGWTVFTEEFYGIKRLVIPELFDFDDRIFEENRWR
jgi:hypothetical protein